MAKFEVIVGNIGTVMHSHSEIEAVECFRHFVFDSIDQRGRAAGEDVTLFEDGHIIDEHFAL
jgi:hypothetical protein